MRYRHLIVVPAVLLLAACNPLPAVTPMTSIADGVQQSDELLAAALDPTKPGCSAAVGSEGAVAWAGAVGLADVDAGLPLTTESVFDLASVSKQFTAVAILLLVHDGAISLSDALSDHLAGLPSWADTVTLEQLLHHRSGIPDYTPLLGVSPEQPASQADAIAALTKTELAFDSGSRFEYSNSNYILLAEVVETITAQPLATVLADRVFGPLELDMRLDPAYSDPAVAVPYLGGSADSRSPWTQVGDGSVFTTPSELVRWADVYRTDPFDVLDDALDSAEDIGDGTRYGPGVMVAADGSLSHLGGWSGFVAAFTVSADRTTAVAVQCNDGTQDPRRIADALTKIWGGQP